MTATALAELYRQQELEVPILAPRDGPIAALDPDRVGLLARPVGLGRRRWRRRRGAGGAGRAPGVEGRFRRSVAAVAADSRAAPVTIVAERAAWIRVYLDNGTVIFESILESGQSYTPPDGSDPPLVWAGNSGSVYARIGDTLYGPLGSGTRAAKDVSLAPQAITEQVRGGHRGARGDLAVDGGIPAAAEPAVAIQLTLHCCAAA